MGSSVCVHGSIRDQTKNLVGWRKGRLHELEGLSVHLELRDLVLKKAQTLERMEAVRKKCNQRACLVDNYKHQIQQKLL